MVALESTAGRAAAGGLIVGHGAWPIARTREERAERGDEVRDDEDLEQPCHETRLSQAVYGLLWRTARSRPDLIDYYCVDPTTDNMSITRNNHLCSGSSHVVF